MRIIKDDHTIIPRMGGFFNVINNRRGIIYMVDIYEPYCSCPNFKYSGKTKTGRKRICKHIKMCKGVKSQKI